MSTGGGGGGPFRAALPARRRALSARPSRGAARGASWSCLVRRAADAPSLPAWPPAHPDKLGTARAYRPDELDTGRPAP